MLLFGDFCVCYYRKSDYVGGVENWDFCHGWKELQCKIDELMLKPHRTAIELEILIWTHDVFYLQSNSYFLAPSTKNA